MNQVITKKETLPAGGASAEALIDIGSRPVAPLLDLLLKDKSTKRKTRRL